MLNKRTAIVIFFVLLTIAIGLYLKPRQVHSPKGFVEQSESPRVSAPDIASLLPSLEEKLAKNPDDGDSWALLARSYVELGKYHESFDGFEKAISLNPSDPQLLAEYAEAILITNTPDLSGKVEGLIKKTLSLDPNHKKGQLLAANIGLTKPIRKQPQHESTAVEISGVVKLTPGLANKVSPNDTLFIFAKAVNGPPMPLAAIKTNVSKIPYIYHLNDTHALNPSITLSSAEEVTVIARISKGGDATAQPGDLQGSSGIIEVGDVLQDIEINEVIGF